VRRVRKLEKEVEGKFDKGNVLEGKMTQNCYLSLQPSKRLESHPSCERGFLEQG